MREIKFRAWDRQLESMLVGTNQYGNEEPDPGYRESSAGAFTRLWDALARFNESNRFALMQYTGLKDKNGKEIYEGDVLVYMDISGSGRPRKFPPRKIRWHRDTCNFNVTRPGPDAENEVIGNIYENPELLEDK
jgi:hypothetical protein